MQSPEVRLLLEDMSKSKDWRKALRAQPAYRIVNRTIRSQTQFISLVAIIGVIVLILLYIFPKRDKSFSETIKTSHYNNTYPLTRPIITSSMTTFRIGIIADLDENSKGEGNIWLSYYMKGYLIYNPTHQSILINWDKESPIKLTTSFSLKGRGMELSELVVFNGKLLAFDDKTGLVYEIINDKIIPWILLIDGDGRNTIGFKSEWATVKDKLLYVGSMGKEWTTSNGEFEHHNPQFVKVITPDGQISHHNWISKYKRLREVLGIYWPGYMIHESGVWSTIHQRWFFLPRRCSKEQYNDSTDEHMGCSVLISADENMYNVKVTQILSDSKSTQGFSSFKFIPYTHDSVIVALVTEEIDGRTKTFITAFNINGKVILDNLYISDFKFEGFEFI